MEKNCHQQKVPAVSGTAPLALSQTRVLCVSKQLSNEWVNVPSRKPTSRLGTVRDSALAFQILPECKPQIRLVA